MNAKEAIKICEKARENNKRADLRWANLSGADLSWANLRGADLSEADLSEADLSEAYGNNFYLAYFGQHHCIAAGEYISVGCERHTIKHWLKNYKEIGKKYQYTDSEIAMYGAWIKIVAKNLTVKE